MMAILLALLHRMYLYAGGIRRPSSGDVRLSPHCSGHDGRWPVRVTTQPTCPPDVAGCDIPSDPDDQRKGLAELSARGSVMGGDQVIDVLFEHGEEGARGHLRGKVIRFTRGSR